MSRKRYAPRIPKPADGFRAQDLRSVPRGAWWAKGWLRAIEEIRMGARAGRGKMYAELGQVSSLVVAGTHVEATVLGARPDPYVVRIDFASVGQMKDGMSNDVIECFGEMAAGRMLAGEMPMFVDEFFALHGMSLYPVSGKDRFWCSCPDWSKPCKHIAAVLYLMGDAMVREPSLLLRIRGMAFPDETPLRECPLPLWRGSEKLNDFMARIRRRAGLG